MLVQVEPSSALGPDCAVGGSTLSYQAVRTLMCTGATVTVEIYASNKELFVQGPIKI